MCGGGVRKWDETRGRPEPKISIIRSSTIDIKMSHIFASEQHSSQGKEEFNQ